MPAPPKMSWDLHYKKWQGCTRCPLCEDRNKVVIARGEVPCDVLFIGEAPGESEDRLGFPFAGPAGKLMDRMIADAIHLSGKSPRLAFTNLVCCIPKLEDPETGIKKKTTEPFPEAIQACQPRLAEFVRLADPSVVIRVGRLSQEWLRMQSDFGGQYVYRQQGDSRWDRSAEKILTFYDLVHPAAIIRIEDPTQKQHTITRTVAKLADMFENYDVEVPF